FDNSKALKKSKSMSNLTKGLIIGGSILGAGLIGYEVLGDTVIDKAPTLLKLFRGRKHGKDEQVAKENMQKIYNEIGKLKNSEEWKKEFESTKELIMNYESNNIWSKISYVSSKVDGIYTTNKKNTEDLSKQKLITDDQKKNFNSRLMKKFSDMFSGKIAIRTCASSVMPQGTAESIFYVDMFCEDNVSYGIQKQGNLLTLTAGAGKLEIQYNI
ncbi:MAG: hypothetical protein IJQ10_04030, partial [Clostridia bacterium]|nr:hypothetical protein [Clostridia bacterium]